MDDDPCRWPEPIRRKPGFDRDDRPDPPRCSTREQYLHENDARPKERVAWGRIRDAAAERRFEDR